MVRLRLWGLAVVVACVALGSSDARGAERVNFRRLTSIYSDETKDVALKNPEGLACAASTLIVADTGNGRLLRYTVENRAVRPAGEMRAPELTYPIRVQMNSKGDSFALDGKQRRIARFAAGGQFTGYVNPEGVPSSTTVIPRSFKIDRDDNIYVLDIFSARVLALGPDGKFQRQLGFPKEYGFISDLAVDFKGAIFLLDSVRAMIFVAAKDAKTFTPLTQGLREHLSFPTSLTTDSRGGLYAVDENGSGVVLLGQDGSFLGRQLAMGRKEGLLYYPSQMCINQRDEAFIADRGNSRVQVFAIAR